MTRTRTSVAVAMVVALALLGAACKNDKGGNSVTTGNQTGAKAVKTDFGVSGTDITLGLLTDLSGQFAALGKGATQGAQIFWAEQNAKGGVCGRKVKLETQDHGYNVQNAVSKYRDFKDRILGLQQSLGSPMNTALLQDYTNDKMLTEPVSWASSLLKNQYIVMDGTTYDLEIINGVNYLLQQGKLKDGDTVGYIYQEGEYGENGLKGGRFAAQKHNLKLVEQKIKGSDTDMTAQVAAIKSAGAKVILMTSGPKQSASAASVAKSTGFDVTILSSNPGWATDLVNGPAKDALEADFLVVSSYAPFSSTAPAAARVRDAFKKQFAGDTPQSYVMYGYAQAQIFERVIDKACQNGDLTRDGMFAAFKTLSNVDTGQLIANLDYTKPGQPPSKKVYVAKVSAADEGGLKQVTDLFESPDATAYTVS